MPPSLSAIVEPIAPARLGRSFRWLLSATTINNVGDGVAISAGPLLVASQTRDPLLVSMAVLSEYLPVLLFGVLGGAAADRFDRVRMVVAVNLARAAVLAVLVATIVAGTVNIAIVLVALFVLGTAETFADSASSTLISVRLCGLSRPRRDPVARVRPHRPRGRHATGRERPTAGRLIDAWIEPDGIALRHRV